MTGKSPKMDEQKQMPPSDESKKSEGTGSGTGTEDTTYNITQDKLNTLLTNMKASLEKDMKANLEKEMEDRDRKHEIEIMQLNKKIEATKTKHDKTTMMLQQQVSKQKALSRSSTDDMISKVLDEKLSIKGDKSAGYATSLIAASKLTPIVEQGSLGGNQPQQQYMQLQNEGNEILVQSSDDEQLAPQGQQQYQPQFPGNSTHYYNNHNDYNNFVENDNDRNYNDRNDHNRNYNDRNDRNHNYKDRNDQPNYPRFTNQTIFSGKENEDLEDWIFRLELNFRKNFLPDNQKIIHVHDFLKEDAFEEYKNALTDSITEGTEFTWKSLLKVFRARFRPINYEADHFLNLINTKQAEGQTVRSYIRLFRSNLGKGFRLHPVQQIAAFTSGLVTDSQQFVSAQNPTTLDEAINKALAFDRAQKNKPQATPAIPPDTPINWVQGVDAPFYCYYCGKEGHYTNRCRDLIRDRKKGIYNPKGQSNNNNNNTTQSRPQRSNSFNQYNKSSNNYQNNQNTNNYKQNNNKYPNSKNQNNRNQTNNNTRQNRQSVTHQENAQNVNQDYPRASRGNKKKKPDKEYAEEPMDVGMIKLTQEKIKITCSQKPEALLEIDCLADGKETLAIIDTGSVCSCISLNNCLKLGIEFEPSNRSILVADGKSCPVEGETSCLDIIIETTIVKVKFLVIPTDHINMILGMDWIRKAKAIIDGSNNTITFGSSSIKINNQTQSDSENEQDQNNSINQINMIKLDPKHLEETDFSDDDYNASSKNFIPPKLDKQPQSIQTEFDKLCNQYKKLFAFDLMDLKEPCRVETLTIETTSEKPLVMPPYRRAFREHEEIEVEIQKLLRAKIIRPSTSPWSVEVVMVKKQGKANRLCFNYKPLNAITTKDQFPIPRIDDITEGLNGSVYFSTLDGTKCYNQFEIAESSKAKAAFSTKTGHFEPNRVLFGLVNAPCLLARAMRKIFRNLPFVKYYFDDILIHTPDNARLHLKHIAAVLKILKEVNLKINPDKCKFFRTTIDILGVTISNNVVMMDRKKVQAIVEWKEPVNIKTLESFLGFAGYQRKFIKDYASITAPLENLKNKDTKFLWSQDCQKSFDYLKNKIASYPILRQPDMTRPFYVMSDCSNNAMGAALNQYDQNNNEYNVDNKSKKLHGAELHYGTSEKECLALVWAVTGWRTHLYGSKNYAVVDHKALLWLMKYRDKNAKLMRWSIILQAYDLEYIYRPGKYHGNADGLSRAVYTINTIEEDTTLESSTQQFEEDTNSKALEPYEDENLLKFLKTGKFLDGTSKKMCKRITRQNDFYKYANDTLWHRDSVDSTDFKTVPKPSERKELIIKHHSFGHFSPQGTFDYIKEKFYWPKMLEQITHEYKQCLQCLKNPLGPGKLTHSAIAIPITGVFDMIGIDSVEGFPDVNGYHCVITIKDHASKLIMVEPTKSKSAEEATIVLWRWICTYGPPKKMMSDQGRQFVNDVITNLLSTFCIQHKITSPYHPETNGATEIINKMVTNCLRKLVKENPNNWPKLVPFVVLAYNNKVNNVTKYSPYVVVLGKSPNRFEDWTNKSNEDEATALLVRANEIRTMYEKTRPEVLQNINKAQTQQKKSQDNRSKKILDANLDIGTQVMLKTEGINPKLNQMYTGPYTIVDVGKLNNYQLKDINNHILDKYFNINRLRIVDLDESDEEIIPSQSNEEISNPNAAGTSKSLNRTALPFNTNPQKSSIRSRKKKDILELPSEEIEKIIGHKKEKSRFLYLVKWVGCPEEENEWLEAKAFDNPETLNKYWAKQPVDLRTAKYSIPKSTKSKRVSKVSFLTMLMIILINVMSSTSFQINGNFKHCKINNNSPFVDIYDTCHTFETHPSYVNAQSSILEKRQYAIEGNGFECFKNRITTKTSKNFWGQHVTYRNEEHMEISKDECNIMSEYKRCNKNKMTCTNDICTYDKEANIKWSYFRELTFKSDKCLMKKIHLTAKHIKTPLFRGKPLCTVSELFCKLDSSTIIWTNEIIHTCPYNLIIKTKLNISNQIAISNKNNLFLQLTNSIYEPTCKFTVIGTTEGLYITQDTLPKDLNKAAISLNAKSHLTLSDSDYKNYNLFNIITRLNKAENERICELNKQLLRLYEKRPNEFHIIQNKELKPIVIFNLEGEILETTCTKINSIIIHELTTECFENAQVSIITNKTTTTAYLGQDGIISDYAIKRNCEINKRLLLPNSESYIRLINKKVFKIQAKNEISITFQEEPEHFKVQHIDQIVKDYDNMKEFENTEFEFTNHKSIHMEDNNNNNLFQMVNHFENKYNRTKTTLIIFLIIFSLSLIMIITYKLQKIIRQFLQKRKSNINTNAIYDKINDQIILSPNSNTAKSNASLYPDLKTPNSTYNQQINVNTPILNVNMETQSEVELIKVVKED